MTKLMQLSSGEVFIVVTLIIGLIALVKLKKCGTSFLYKTLLYKFISKWRRILNHKILVTLASSLMIIFMTVTISGCSNSVDSVANPVIEEQLQKEEHYENEKVQENQQNSVEEDTANDIVDDAVQGEIKIHFIDVGQADAILVEQGSHAMMVDGGNNEDSSLVKSYIDNQGIETLDFVVGTHPHEDHIGGLDYIINSFKIGKIYMPKVTSNTKTFSDVVTTAQNKGLKFSTPVPGETFKLGEATCTILAPNGSSYEDLNNHSIVIKIAFGDTSFLLTGDAEALSEKEIISKGYDIESTVLKIGHHGSNSSSSTEFLDKVNPKYAVISVGKDNTYDHPKQNVLDRLKAKGITVYRTDESGTIIASSDGAKVTFNTDPGSYKGFAGLNEKGEEVSSNSDTLGYKSSSDGASADSTIKTDASKVSRVVYWTPNGKSYHYDKNCSTLSRSKVINQGELSASPKSDPCDVCVN